MKVKFKYRISGLTKDCEGQVSGEGVDYNATMQDAYNQICTNRHNSFLTVTFKKIG